MKRIHQSRRRLYTTLSILVLAFTACSKNGTSTLTPPPPPPPPQACQLIDETKSSTNGYEHYWYTFRKDGKLDSIYYSQAAGSGAVAYCREDGGGFLWISFTGTDGKTPDKYDYEYTNSLQDSATFPGSLGTSFQLWDGVNNAGYGYNFQYKASGKLDGYAQTAPFVTGLLEGLGVEYDGNGDISAMTYAVITGPKVSLYVTATAFDGHPSPYTCFSGWAFMTPATQWTSPEYEQLMYALSPHNPTASTFTSSSSTEKLTDVMTYEYNTQGYPTKRTMVRTNSSGNSTTFTHTYTYNCH